MKTRTLFLFLVCATFFSNLFGQDPYRLDLGKETGILAGSLIGARIGFSLYGKVEPFTAEDLSSLNRNTVNSFDRAATFSAA